MGGGGYYDPSNGYGYGYADPPVPPASQLTAVPMVYPPQPPMIQMGPDGQFASQPPRQPAPQAYQQAPQDAQAEPASDTQQQYLIAFKDHTIYSTMAYWFDGDTLHYFTNGNTHNQASVSLIDRDLTVRLNKEMGNDFVMPPAK